MKPDAFNNQISKGDIPPVCLLYGEEPLLIRESLDLIRRKLLGGEGAAFEQEIFYGSDSDASTILQSAQTLSLFGGRKLIVIKGVDRMPDSEKARLLDYVKSPVPKITVVLTAVKPDMRKKFFAQLQKQWPAVRFYHPYDVNETVKWIRSYLKRKGFEIDLQGARFLCDAHGRELQAIKSELDKLILYKGQPGEIGLPEITAVSGQSQEFNAFELADAVGDKDADRALRVLSRLIADGVPLLMILGALAAKFRKLWMGKTLEQKGQTQREILRSLAIHYKGERFMEQLSGFQEEEIAAFYSRLLEIDEAIKGGSSRPETFMEMAIHRLCRGKLRSGSQAVNLAREN